MGFPTMNDYLPRHAATILKIASAPSAEPSYTGDSKRALKLFAAGAAGLVAGTLGGVAAGKLFEHLRGRPSPGELKLLLPIVGGGSALLYSMAKRKEFEKAQGG